MKERVVDKFSKDILADAQEYYVSCAEMVARHLAERLSSFRSAAELCCMVGATTAQLARKIPEVCGVDIDSRRIEKAITNAKLYGVEDRVKFIHGDVLDVKVLKNISAEVAILDPTWRHPGEDRYKFVDSVDDTTPNLKEMFDMTKKYVTANIVLRIPRNFTFETLKSFGQCEIENLIWGDVVRYKFAYFSSKIKKNVEKNIYFPIFTYKNDNDFYSPWNGKEHPDYKRVGEIKNKIVKKH